MDAEAIGRALYGAPAAPAAETTPAEPPAERSIAERMYSKPPAPTIDVPSSVKELRSTDDRIEAALYPSPPPHHEVVAALKAIEPDAELVQAEATEWARVAKDVNANADDVSLAVNTIRRLSSKPMSDAEEAASSLQAHEALERKYGADAPKARASIRALLDRDPRLSKQLIDSGALFDSDVYLALGRLAVGQVARGRLNVSQG